MVQTLEEKREYQRKYRKTHSDKVKKWRRSYYNTHREQICAKASEWRKQHPDYSRKISQAWREQHPEYSREWREQHYDQQQIYDYKYNKTHLEAKRKTRRKRLYGITHENYEQLLENQNGVCAICGENRSKHALGVDHNHTTKSIRGLLCKKCNIALGYMEDNIGWLQKMISYLELHNEDNNETNSSNH